MDGAAKPAADPYRIPCETRAPSTLNSLPTQGCFSAPGTVPNSRRCIWDKRAGALRHRLAQSRSLDIAFETSGRGDGPAWKYDKRDVGYWLRWIPC